MPRLTSRTLGGTVDSMHAIVDSSDGDLARTVAALRPGSAEAAEASCIAASLRACACTACGTCATRTPRGDLVQQVMLLTIEKLRAGAVRDADQIASFILGTSRMMAKDLKRREWRRETAARALPAASIVEAPAGDAASRPRSPRALPGTARRSRALGRAADFLCGEDRDRGRRRAPADGGQRARDQASRDRASSKVHRVTRGGPMMSACRAPILDETLLDYWAGDLADGDEMDGWRSICSPVATARRRLARLVALGRRVWRRSCARGASAASSRAPSSIVCNVMACTCGSSRSCRVKPCRARSFPATTSSSPAAGGLLGRGRGDALGDRPRQHAIQPVR